MTQVRRGGRNGGIEGYAIRNDRYRYIEWDGGAKGRELYDHQKDPREHHNLADDPAHASTLADMQRLLREAKATWQGGSE